MNVAVHKIPAPLRRLVFGALALALLALLVAEVASGSATYWHAIAFAVAPDLALLYGVGRSLAPGQLHPRAVPLYNAAHRFVGPALLGVAAAAGALPSVYLVAAVAWAFHVALDRAVGYDLRDRDGFKRA